MATFLHQLSPSSIAILSFFSIYLIYRIIQQSIKVHRQNLIIRKNGCKPIASYHHRDPIFGLDLFLANLKLARSGGMWDGFRERYISLDRWTFSQLFLGDRIITTAEPENIKAMLATQFHDFGLPPRRKDVRSRNQSPSLSHTAG